MSRSPADAPQGTVHAPGTVFWMEPYSDALPGDGSATGHPHVLLLEGRPGLECPLAYGSTKETEAAAMAKRLTVRARRAGVNANGLSRTTNFYPGVLSNRMYARLPARAGRIGPDLARLRGEMRLALGIGTGCVGTGSHPLTSWRGRIVRLTNVAGRLLKTRFAVVLTDPVYSAACNYQVVAPIYDGTGRTPSKSTIVATGVPWLSLLREGGEVTSALILIPFTCSIWHERHLESDTGFVLSEELMTQVDAMLCERFQLPSYD